MKKPFPFALAGLLTASGKYSAAQWTALARVSPLDYPAYFKESNGLVYCTSIFRADYTLLMQQAKYNWNALGVNT
jgi:hypothetical protein